MEGDILLLTMDEEQKIKLTEQYGDNGNIYTLKEFTGEETDIPNPYGKPLNVYGECLETLSKLIHKLTEKLNSFTEGGA